MRWYTGQSGFNIMIYIRPICKRYEQHSIAYDLFIFIECLFEATQSVRLRLCAHKDRKRIKVMFRTHYDEKQKLWSGCKFPSLYNPTISIGHMILSALKIHSSKIAQVIQIKFIAKFR